MEVLYVKGRRGGRFRRPIYMTLKNYPLLISMFWKEIMFVMYILKDYNDVYQAFCGGWGEVDHITMTALKDVVVWRGKKEFGNYLNDDCRGFWGCLNHYFTKAVVVRNNITSWKSLCVKLQFDNH